MRGAWSAEMSWARAGRAGVSAHLLMAGIWGVIERGGRPGARVGLHEQLNVIRPRPSGSSWVIDNPAGMRPGPGPSRPGAALLARDAHGSREKPSDLPCPLLRGLFLAGLPGAAGAGKAPRGGGDREPPERGEASAGAGPAGAGGVPAINRAQNRWNRGRKK